MKNMILTVVVAAIGYVLGWTVINSASSVLGHVPQIETALVPIIARDGEVTKTYRDADKLCFGIPLTKLSFGILVAHEFAVRPPTSPSKLNLAVYPTDSNWKPLPNNRDLPTHPVGQHWISYYCSNMPGAINARQTLEVSGTAIHRRHPFWNSVTPLPAFEIGPVSESFHAIPEKTQVGHLELPPLASPILALSR